MIQVRGHVFDDAGRAVANAEVAAMWRFRDGRLRAVAPSQSTGAAGDFALELEIWDTAALVIFDQQRRRGAFLRGTPQRFRQPLKIRLEPIGHIAVTADVAAVAAANPQATVLLDARSSKFNSVLRADLPVGGTRIPFPASRLPHLTLLFGNAMPHRTAVTIASEQTSEIAVVFRPSPLSAVGSPAPQWHIEARAPASTTVALAGYRGRWVLVEFWSYWCGSCIMSSIPELIALHEEFADLRAHFAIVLLHNSDVDTIDGLHDQLAKVTQIRWDSRRCPLPILIDDDNATNRAYGIAGYPTLVLIDPQGRIAGTDAVTQLRAELQALRKRGASTP